MTVVAQDPYALGRHAGELLFERLAGATAAAVGRRPDAADRARVGRDPSRIPEPVRCGRAERPLRFVPTTRRVSQRPAADDEGRRRRSPASASARSRAWSTAARRSRRSWPSRCSARSRCSATGTTTPPGTLRRANGAVGLARPDLRGRLEPVLLRHPPRRRGGRPRRASVVTFAGSSDEDPERERELIEARARAPRRRPDRRPHRAATTATCCATSRRASALVFVDRPPQTIDADCVLSDNRGGAEARGRAPDRARPPPDRVRRLAAGPLHLRRAARRLPRRAAPAGIAEELVRHPIEPAAFERRSRLLAAAGRADRAVHRPEPDHDRGPARAAPARPPARDRATSAFDDIVLAGCGRAGASRSSPRTRSGSGAPPPSCCSRGSTATRARRAGSCSRPR